MTSFRLCTDGAPAELARAVLGAPWESAVGLLPSDTALLPSDPVAAGQVVVTIGNASAADQLLRDVGQPVLLVGPALGALQQGSAAADRAGLTWRAVSAPHEVRVRLGAQLDPRDDGDLLVHGRLSVLEPEASDVEVLATASLGLATHPVATWRPATRTLTLAVEPGPAAWSDPRWLRTVRRLVDVAAGGPPASPVRVGLLGYGAIGSRHADACQTVPGLQLAAVCDADDRRRKEAEDRAPGVAVLDDADGLLQADVDLVVVSTPPDSHAAWALRLLSAGKHVVLEKPMALTTREADAVLAEAESADRLVVVYQNRRFDPDFLALQRAVRGGRLGEVFHVEAFVGGYGHPCNFWHSDAGVSGGALFDWGSHYVDQVLRLVPESVVSVSAADHKLRWHDVTNADHSRLTMRFASGAEATFVHSDLAAAAKPKWYVLGTEGAVVGSWRLETVLSRDDIGALAEDVLAPADSPAGLDLHHPDGSVTRLATPEPAAHPFHRELADHLLEGLPMTVTAHQSRDVVAVLEAATISAANGGPLVEPGR